MEKKEFEKIVKAEYNTEGHKKFIRYFEEVLNTKPFQEEIVRIRKKYKIPVNGFSNKEMIYPPRDWIYRHTEKGAELSKEVEKLCEKSHLHFADSMLLLQSYIFYNKKFNPKNIVYSLGTFNLLHVSDLAEEKKEPFSDFFQNSDNLAYPIALRVSPYASLRDILDFTKKVYTNSILPLQNKYRTKGVRIGKNKKRKDFVYYYA